MEKKAEHDTMCVYTHVCISNINMKSVICQLKIEHKGQIYGNTFSDKVRRAIHLLNKWYCQVDVNSEKNK